jgi:hypothetical protein
LELRVRGAKPLSARCSFTSSTTRFSKARLSLPWGSVGFTVGAAVGVAVGFAVAAGVSVITGVAVGFAVGAAVAVGTAVGFAVTAGVSAGLSVATGVDVTTGVGMGFTVLKQFEFAISFFRSSLIAVFNLEFMRPEPEITESATLFLHDV